MCGLNHIHWQELRCREKDYVYESLHAFLYLSSFFLSPLTPSVLTHSTCCVPSSQLISDVEEIKAPRNTEITFLKGFTKSTGYSKMCHQSKGWN